MDAATSRIVKSETDDTFLFTLEFRERRHRDDESRPSPTTPTRGARIVVMGDNGTLIAEQPGPNPEENGVVIGEPRRRRRCSRSRRRSNTRPSRTTATIG